MSLPISPSCGRIASLLGDRLVVGRLTLDQQAGVQIPVPQPFPVMPLEAEPGKARTLLVRAVFYWI